MEPIKPIDRVPSDSQDKFSGLAKSSIHNHYLMQQTEIKQQIVESSGESSEVSAKREEDPEKRTNQTLRNTYAEFEINQETHEVIIRIIDADSGKLVRSIPPEELAKEIVKGNFQPNQLRRRAVLV